MTGTPAFHRPGAQLIARRAGIDTYQAPVVYMRADCEICRSEGFQAQARVELAQRERDAIGTGAGRHHEHCGGNDGDGGPDQQTATALGHGDHRLVGWVLRESRADYWGGPTYSYTAGRFR